MYGGGLFCPLYPLLICRNKKDCYPGTLKRGIETRQYYKTKEYLPFNFRIWCTYFVILSVVTVSQTKNYMYCYLLVEISTSQLSQNINSYIKSSSTSIDPVYIFFYFDNCYYFILKPKLHCQIFIFGNFPSFHYTIES